MYEKQSFLLVFFFSMILIMHILSYEIKYWLLVGESTLTYSVYIHHDRNCAGNFLRQQGSKGLIMLHPGACILPDFFTCLDLWEWEPAMELFVWLCHWISSYCFCFCCRNFNIQTYVLYGLRHHKFQLKFLKMDVCFGRA